MQKTKRNSILNCYDLVKFTGSYVEVGGLVAEKAWRMASAPVPDQFFLQEIQVYLHATHGQILRLPETRHVGNPNSSSRTVAYAAWCDKPSPWQHVTFSPLSSAARLQSAALQDCNQRVNGHANLLTSPHHLHHGERLAQSNPRCSCTELHSQAWEINTRIALKHVAPHKYNNSWPQKKSWSIEQKSSFHPFLWKPICRGPPPRLDGNLCFRTGAKLQERIGLFTSLTARSCPSRIAWQHPTHVFWGEISSSPGTPL